MVYDFEEILLETESERISEKLPSKIVLPLKRSWKEKLTLLGIESATDSYVPLEEMCAENSPYQKVISKYVGGNLAEQFKVHFEGIPSNFVRWYLEHLVDPVRYPSLFAIAGELSFFAKYERILAPFYINALEKGAVISYICGPEIMEGCENPFFKLLKTQGTGKMFIHYIRPESSKFFPKFHFAVAGDDVYIEEPHDPHSSSEDIVGYSIKDSCFMRNDLIREYRKTVNKIIPFEMQSSGQKAVLLTDRNTEYINEHIIKRLSD